MSTWFYRQAEQAVGPFDRDVLDKLKGAGVIDDATPVKSSDAADWLPFGHLNAQQDTAPDVPPPMPAPPAACYYYLDANRQPVGPFDLETLGRLHAQTVIAADTLVSGIGDQQWVPASQILGLSRNGYSAVSGVEPQAVQTLPVRRSFDQFALMMGCTLTLYMFYLIPSYSRDMRAITGKARMEFNPMLILGIVTLSISLVVTMVLWAFELERHGKNVGKVGRQDSLGLAVLALNVIALVCGFAIDNFVLSFAIGAGFGVWAIWLLQKEINLYVPSNQSS